ncbi:F-box/kelch-repeat protein SKIP11-like [Iris pallida]|uniref:F-box/kelch-repeat protein SKIP11-like n=1 Tax=Iris pallida TaxID=29817 RepID=A0AAX6DJ44_IRIPA|nr:F-box/kelch-repeat protein SKIP11-like [Iris pallida]KAJ6791738.1 F-box/kelch-repeat protein SKIP11-like [Iris pallida]KAJ6798979.1 F-box/kelch-repeat protein SKIP11-like [Iris pallida]
MLEGQSCLISRALPSACEQESKWMYMTCNLLERTSKRPLPPDLEPEEDFDRDCEKKRKKNLPPKLPNSPTLELSSVPGNEGGGDSYFDSNSLINPIGRDISINCLIRCSRSDYGSIASLNCGFRDLIRTGELYRLRRLAGFTEHWVYFSCNVLEWEAYDPYRGRWTNLPRMPHNECFMFSDKESLAVGTDLLVFGKEVTSHVVLRYSILNNTWTPGVGMNSPRCLFGSASLGEKAIIAGGDAHGTILDSAELYNSETQTWETLPKMKRPRKMCSGVFMDGKFYVIGGSVRNNELLTCGEEYDLEIGTWRVIPNMALGLSGASGAPPLVAVVNNELYAADYGQKEVRKYDKINNTWITLGSLPERPASMNGWGLAFRACGDRLIVIGGPRVLGGGMIEVHAWVPRDGPPEWNMIASKHSGSFVYNCAVMGC